MKGSNRGFTLIELLVAVAILGILAVAEVTFMSAGAGLYRSVFGNVSLQVESQTAMNQLENAVINCSGGICFDGRTLYVINPENSQYAEYVFEFDSGKKEIDYSKFIIPAGGPKPPEPAESGLMASDVEKLSVAFPASGGNVSSVEIQADFARQGVTCSADQIVSPRNLPATASGEASLIGNVCK